MAQKTRAMYSRGDFSGYGKTIVPGIDEGLKGKPTSNGEGQKERPMASSEPVAGFLYSISRTAAGEYWPLHLGENTIGRDSSNDICLPEMTVSGQHATLVIRRMKTTNEYLADIYVKGVNGAFVNETEVLREAECNDGDFITIGDNYVLYLIILNPFKLNMKVSESFVPADDLPAGDSPYGEEPYEPASDRTSHLYDSRRRASGGTEGMDGGPEPFMDGQTSML